MRSIEAKCHPRPNIVRKRVSEVAELLESAPERRARSRRAFDPHFEPTWDGPEAFRVRPGVALYTRVTVVEIVPRMRHDRAHSERARALQLLAKTRDAPGAQDRIRRREVDEIAVM